MKKLKIFLCIIYLFVFCSPTLAIQTVFNVPSADVTEKGHTYFLDEAQFRAWGADANYVSTNFLDYGIGYNTDIGLGVYNVGAPATGNISLGFGFKSAMPIPVLKEKFPKREIKLTVGSQILTSVEGNGVGNWTYTHLSGRLPVVNTRLTAGISYGTRQLFGVDHTCFIAAVEQPVTKKLSVISDWYSGPEHYAGFLITGISYSLPKSTTLYAGYQIPNSPKNGTSGFVIQLAKIF